MAFLLLPLAPVIWAAGLAANAFAVLVIVRLVVTWWSPRWLAAIDAVGKPVVDSWLAWISRGKRGPGRPGVSANTVLMLTLAGLWLISNVLGSVACSWFGGGGASVERVGCCLADGGCEHA